MARRRLPALLLLRGCARTAEGGRPRGGCGARGWAPRASASTRSRKAEEEAAAATAEPAGGRGSGGGGGGRGRGREGRPWQPRGAVSRLELRVGWRLAVTLPLSWLDAKRTRCRRLCPPVKRPRHRPSPCLLSQPATRGRPAGCLASITGNSAIFSCAARAGAPVVAAWLRGPALAPAPRPRLPSPPRLSACPASSLRSLLAPRAFYFVFLCPQA